MPKHDARHQKLLDDLQAAAKAFIEGNDGDAWIIGPVRIEVRKATQFDVVIECVGRGPSIRPESVPFEIGKLGPPASRIVVKPRIRVSLCAFAAARQSEPKSEPKTLLIGQKLYMVCQ